MNTMLFKCQTRHGIQIAALESKMTLFKVKMSFYCKILYREEKTHYRMEGNK